MTANELPALTRDGDVFVLDLGETENRFSPEWLDTVDALLDKVTEQGPGALVTIARGKFWSNGLDLEWLTAHGDEAQSYVHRVHGLFSRVLTLPVPTVAAITGHAFGAGAMLAMAHDFRVMRADRGYLCFPEVDIRIPFAPGMAALIQAKLTPATARTAMLTGRRYGGAEAAEAGLVDASAAEDAVRSAALDLVRPLAAKDPGTLGAIKSTMYASVVTALAG
ncbi:enoyl-CoA hydratase-related protein [Amycolatopsis anabasis]|uniref:enoyl-CoA hydratase-related protein n=1 Tax=Amycolatopsis anabasis TaxID=1840409 RepID=UPI00131E41D7|nr:enoyl-CoA hydratase-related protein [Amycolatopsis anabasis]